MGVNVVITGACATNVVRILNSAGIMVFEGVESTVWEFLNSNTADLKQSA